jgi:hypothetical protein
MMELSNYARPRVGWILTTGRQKTVWNEPSERLGVGACTIEDEPVSKHPKMCRMSVH